MAISSRRNDPSRAVANLALSDLDIHDYVVLALVAVIGLVLTRILYTYGIVTSACVEHMLTFGHVRHGPLTGLTAWSALRLTCVLAALYALVVAFRSRRNSWVVTVLHALSSVLLGCIAVMLHRGIIPDLAAPDLVIPIKTYFDHDSPNEAVQTMALEGFTSDWLSVPASREDEYLRERLDCLYTSRRQLVLPEPDGLRAPNTGSVRLDLRAMIERQTYVDLTPAQLDEILDHAQTLGPGDAYIRSLRTD